MVYKNSFFLLFCLLTSIYGSGNGGNLQNSLNFKQKCILFGSIATIFATPFAISYKLGGEPDTVNLAKTIGADLLGALSFILPSAFIYEVGKRGYIAYLSEYLKKGDNRFNVTFKINKPGKLKIGLDIPIWGISLLASAGILKLLPPFAQYNHQWAASAMLLGQILVSVWAQQQFLPVKYNPFVWTDANGNDESVLIFPSRCGLQLRGAGGAVYKKL